MSKSDDDESLIERVRSVASRLTATEQRLISELLKAPRDVALGTSSEFAARLGVHEATTSRLARKLGFRSYAAFRERLRREFLQGAPASRISATLSDAREKGFLPLLVTSEIEALAAIADHVDDARILAAAEALDRKRVFIHAHGNAEMLAVLMDRRLRRLGVAVHRLSGSRRDLAEQMLSLTAEDALLVFAFRRQPPDFRPLMDVAAETGASTVVVADTIGPSLVPVPDLLLAAPRAGMENGYQTLTVPMAICNAMVLALVDRRGREALDHLERLGLLIARFEE